MARAARKERRTFSLDPELVRYIERVRKEYRTASASSALEEIIRKSKRQQERQHQDELIAGYYSSLGDSQIEQESEWGKFAETQFPKG